MLTSGGVPIYSRKVEVQLPFLTLLLSLLSFSPRLGGRPIGRTPDSDSGYPGSSPGLPANITFIGFLPVLASGNYLR